MAAEDEDDEMEDNGKINVGPDPLGLGIRTVCWVADDDDDVAGSSNLILFTVDGVVCTVESVSLTVVSGEAGLDCVLVTVVTGDDDLPASITGGSGALKFFNCPGGRRDGGSGILSTSWISLPVAFSCLILCDTKAGRSLSISAKFGYNVRMSMLFSGSCSRIRVAKDAVV